MLARRVFTNDDFNRQPRAPRATDVWVAEIPLDNPLGPFGVEIDALPIPELLQRVNEYALALSDQYDAIFNFIHEDYLQASEDKYWMKGCGVPRGLREDRVMKYIRGRYIYVGHGGGYVSICPQWNTEHGLRLVLQKGRLVSIPG